VTELAKVEPGGDNSGWVKERGADQVIVADVGRLADAGARYRQAGAGRQEQRGKQHLMLSMRVR
jgi:hypothetical protein